MSNIITRKFPTIICAIHFGLFVFLAYNLYCDPTMGTPPNTYMPLAKFKAFGTICDVVVSAGPSIGSLNHIPVEECEALKTAFDACTRPDFYVTSPSKGYMTGKEFQAFRSICEIYLNAGPVVESLNPMSDEDCKAFKTVFDACHKSNLFTISPTEGNFTSKEYESFKTVSEILRHKK